ncbi:MAG: hypothetical protein IJV40_03815 [Oscillospiraceae bacterium]|nr:hypothetical protein [Oscillospiraceae bacterium]
MDAVSMSSLLQTEEEKLRSELKADAVIDRNRKQSVERLNAALDRVLLRYNAANTDDRSRQAIADCEAAAVRDMLGLLLAGTARKEITKRRLRAGAIIALLLAVICGLVSALLIRRYYLAGCIAVGAAALFAFLSGRLWYGEREVRVHAELDPDVVWKTLKRTAETMDRKTEEFLSQQEAWAQDAAPDPAGSELPLSPDELKLLSELLEALYANNGEFALRQLKRIQPWLRQKGIETVDYSEETRELFELLPTKRDTATQRPALLYEDRLLVAGKATEHVN